MSIIDRVRVLTGNYYCPDCYHISCTNRCGRRHQKELSEISEIIGRQAGLGGDFTTARQLLDDLAIKTGDNEPEITRLRTLISFFEGI